MIIKFESSSGIYRWINSQYIVQAYTDNQQYEVELINGNHIKVDKITFYEIVNQMKDEGK